MISLPSCFNYSKLLEQVSDTIEALNPIPITLGFLLYHHIEQIIGI